MLFTSICAPAPTAPWAVTGLPNTPTSPPISTRRKIPVWTEFWRHRNDTHDMPHVMTRNDLDASLPARRKAALRARVRLRLGRGRRRTATASADSSSTAAAEKTTRFYLLSEKLLVGGESESTI